MTLNPNREPRDDGRAHALRTLWATCRSVFQGGWDSLVGMAESVAGMASTGSIHARRALSHSFETRIAVAAVLVLSSAAVGYELGGWVIAAGPESASEAIDDALAHAEHAFDLGEPDSSDLIEDRKSVV